MTFSQGALRLEAEKHGYGFTDKFIRIAALETLQ
jgi:hypothetical protein